MGRIFNKKKDNRKIDVFRSVFVGRADVYGTFAPESGRSWQVKRPVTCKVISDHLSGVQSLGLYLLRGDRSSALVFDFDKPDPFLPKSCVRKLRRHGIPSYVERSKSKGFHVWVFFSRDGVLASKARRIAKWVLDRMRRPETEIFPKQDRLEHPGQYGNFINLPLFGRFVPEGRMVFLDESFEPYPDQWAFLESINRVSARHLDYCLNRIQFKTPERSNKKRPTRILQISRRSNSLLPCASRMLVEGVSWNQRIACFRLAFHLRRAGVPFISAIGQLNQWAVRNQPKAGNGIIREYEIRSQTQAAYARAYTSLGCEDTIMQAFCDSNCPVRKSRSKN